MEFEMKRLAGSGWMAFAVLALLVTGCKVHRYDCEAEAAKAEKCFNACFQERMSRVPRPCGTSSMRFCNHGCLPRDVVVKECRTMLCDRLQGWYGLDCTDNKR